MFKFNFNQEKEAAGQETKAATAEKDVGGGGSDVTWIAAKEHILCESHLEQLGEDSSIVIHDFQLSQGDVISYLDSEEVSQRLKCQPQASPSSSSTAIATALNNYSDLLPGVYEGGMKIWECSVDLVRYLDKSDDDWHGRRVLELGCGAGLPGLYCLLRGADVDFQDYNADVVENITIPNVLINAPSCGGGSSEGMAESRFMSGDWASVEELVREKGWKETYDVILTSETIYNVENQAKLISMFETCLKRGGEKEEGGGKVYLAAKSHYFGVGGGLRQFEEVLEGSGKWKFRNVETISNDVRRAIILIERK